MCAPDAAQNKIGVFISYCRPDALVAAALREALIAVSSELNPFIDHVKLDPGDDYESKIRDSIGRSQWFLMICSGPLGIDKDMGWCLYEAGQFRAKLTPQNNALNIPRLVAIHDDARPRQLEKYLSVQISGKDLDGNILDFNAESSPKDIRFENTAIFHLFESLVRESRTEPLNDLADLNVRSLLRKNARDVILAFKRNEVDRKLPEVVFQSRISFLLPSPGTNLSSKLTPETLVTGDGESLRAVFGIAGNETTWGKIKATAKEEDGHDPLWIGEIEAAAESVSQDLVPFQPDGLCIAKDDQKFFEVLFARYEPFRSRARICYVVFVPRRIRNFDVKQRTSILLSALILSIRFRQRILPFIDNFDKLERKDKLKKFLQLETEIHESEMEAQEFGMRLPMSSEDEPPVARQFRDGSNKSFVLGAIRDWQISRMILAEAFRKARTTNPGEDPIEAGVNGGRIAVRELKKVRHVNDRFIQLLIGELLFVENVPSGVEREPSVHRG